MSEFGLQADIRHTVLVQIKHVLECVFCDVGLHLCICTYIQNISVRATETCMYTLRVSEDIDFVLYLGLY